MSNHYKIIILEFLTQPWPWYFGGAMIAIVVFLLLWTGKTFGISSNLRTLYSIMGAGKKAFFFKFDWKAQHMKTIIYIFICVFFGITLYMSEVSSWFRIYEMFQFNSFHMYGVIGSAVFFGAIFTFLIKKLKVKSIFDQTPISLNDKEKGWKRYLFGGIIFGFGWAISGACPGPMFSLLVAGFMPIAIVIGSAILGIFFYGLTHSKLPH